jgi:hypothetical protein
MFGAVNARTENERTGGKMNAGRDHEAAKRQAQANANRTGTARYLHSYGGTYWIDRDDPVDAVGCVETFAPQRDRNAERRERNAILRAAVGGL